MTFDFKTQFDVGESGEEYLDKHYSKLYQIKKVTDFELQKRGVDRVFKSHDCSHSCWFTVEYKVDFKAGETGNIFVEIAVNKGSEKGFGWAQKLFAQALLYYVPAKRTCYFCSSLHLKGHIEKWAQSHRISKPVQNKESNGNEYHGIGILVPIDAFVDACCVRQDLIVT